MGESWELPWHGKSPRNTLYPSALIPLSSLTPSRQTTLAPAEALETSETTALSLSGLLCWGCESSPRPQIWAVVSGWPC